MKQINFLLLYWFRILAFIFLLQTKILSTI